MQKSLVLTAALACALALPAAASRAQDATGNHIPELDNLGTGMSKDQINTELNPQPLPPGHHLPSAELNPQPLPPGIAAPSGASTELNPQPLPPGLKSPNQVELNPQPLPPGAK